MNTMYREGQLSRRNRYTTGACPYGHLTHHNGLETGPMMGLSELAKRHWWLAGWHDMDIEMGHRVAEVAA
ncbi:MAG: hypothetical protein R3215_11120 [Halomonas sp.]|nr:hypothetical protein [Halomonas sp.]